MSGMAYGNAVGRRVDIVMCIDGTGSMAGCIDNVKTNIIRLYETINADLEKGGNSVVEILRSEERRVGKECRSRWSPYH